MRIMLFPQYNRPGACFVGSQSGRSSAAPACEAIPDSPRHAALHVYTTDELDRSDGEPRNMKRLNVGSLVADSNPN